MKQHILPVKMAKMADINGNERMAGGYLIAMRTKIIGARKPKAGGSDIMQITASKSRRRWLCTAWLVQGCPSAARVAT